MDARAKPGHDEGMAPVGETRASLSRRERPSRAVRRDRVRGCAAATEGAFCGGGQVAVAGQRTPSADGA